MGANPCIRYLYWQTCHWFCTAHLWHSLLPVFCLIYEVKIIGKNKYKSTVCLLLSSEVTQVPSFICAITWSSHINQLLRPVHPVPLSETPNAIGNRKRFVRKYTLFRPCALNMFAQGLDYWLTIDRIMSTFFCLSFSWNWTFWDVLQTCLQFPTCELNTNLFQLRSENASRLIKEIPDSFLQKENNLETGICSVRRKIWHFYYCLSLSL